MTTRRAGTPLTPPRQSGLYDPSREHDSCGVGFVVNIKGQKSHKLVEQALEVVINLLHRGACGCEVNTGDGAGILLQLPHRFFQQEAQRLGMVLPEPGAYGVGMVFLPRDPDERGRVQDLFSHIAAEEGQQRENYGSTHGGNYPEGDLPVNLGQEVGQSGSGDRGPHAANGLLDAHRHP